MRGPDGLVADITDGLFCARRALATDGDSHGVVDEYRPVDLAFVPQFPIRGSGSIGSAVIGIELGEGAGLLVVERCAQRRRRRGERLALAHQGLRYQNCIRAIGCRSLAPEQSPALP